MFLQILDILVALLLIVVILMQAQGSGISTAFGGGGEFYRSRQSLEKFLVTATVILAVIFGAISLILLFFHV